MKIIVGLFLGALVAIEGGFGGFMVGFIAGYLLVDRQEMVKRLEQMEVQVAKLLGILEKQEVEKQEVVKPVLERRVAETPEAEKPTVGKSEEVAVPVTEEVPATPPVEERPTRPAGQPELPVQKILVRPAPAYAEEPARPDRLELALEQVRAFIFGGNTLVRVGLVVLFFGFTFLVKYSIDNRLFPLELRLAASAAAGIALTGVGFRLRTKREDFALAVQGGGMAILYMTIFVTYRLYELIPGSAAFALLVITTVLCAMLALFQNSQSLAVLSLLGGFSAPVLASTGEGSHIALFSYYVVLNAGILILAWYKPWRPLNLVGFFCTFGYAGLWMYEAYRPEFFATTEPFLALFFLSYFAIAVLHSRHHPPEVAGPIDGTLVFGLPVVVFSFQAILVDPYQYGLAWSAFVMGAFYATAAYVVYRRAPHVLNILVESYAGIGLILGTMVLPFALDATWTGTGWALEGAALVWLGMRQKRLLLRLSGYLLQIMAGVSFMNGFDGGTDELLPVLNHYYLGFLALSLSALTTAYLVYRNRDQVRREGRPLEGVYFVGGMLWWLIGGLFEIIREMPDRPGYHVTVLFIVATAAVSALLRRPLDWPSARKASLCLLPALGFLLAIDVMIVQHPIEAYGFLVWPLAVGAHFLVLYLADREINVTIGRVLHGAGLWFIAALLVWEATWLLSRWAPGGSFWPLIPYGLVPIIVVMLVSQLAWRSTWPVGTWREGYLLPGSVLLLLAAWYWSLTSVFMWTVNSKPLAYLPLVNSLDLVLGLGVLTSVYWYRTARQLLPEIHLERAREPLLWLLSGTAFLWLNATLARTVHHWGGVPYYYDALFRSTTFHTALTIFWTALAVTVMMIAARRQGRAPWVAAASLLGVTVIKLFLVDLSTISTVARIVTFIVVGLLLLLVGYMAPVPPPRSVLREQNEPVETLP